MTTPCNYDYREVGPHSQTMFLGASVLNFNINLGWGGETSSCSVSLAKDLSAHPNSNAFQDFDNYLRNKDATIVEQDKLRSRAFDSANLNKPIDQQDTNTLQSNLVIKQIAKWDKSIYDDRVTLQPYSLKDLGKKCWPSYLNYNTNNALALNWIDPDPGFIGDPRNFAGNTSIDIIGCPAFFKFADIQFGGMIKNWKYSKGKYDIEINSFSSLLKGCSLILQKYYGSISTIIPNTYTALPDTEQNLAVPYSDVGLVSNPNHPYYNPNAFAGSIFQGNIPNVFNVFGYAENIYGFGTMGFAPERGVSAGIVYDAIVEMLNLISFDGGENYYRNQNQWGPYGAIVAKTPFDRSSGSLIDPSRTYFQFNRTGKKGISNNQLYLADFGLVAAPAAVDGLPRSLFRLDLTEVPRPPNAVFIAQDQMDLLSFIDYCCSNAGVDFIVDFIPDAQPSWYSGTIKIRTISRRVQASPDIIKNFLSSFNAADRVVDFNFGEEFNDTKTRSILVGGPQQRLHQFTTHTYGVYRHSKVWEPALNSWVNLDAISTRQLEMGGNLFNTYREPEYASQRAIQDVNNGPWRGIPSGAAVAQADNNFWSATQNSYTQMTINQGNYIPLIKPSLKTLSTLSSSLSESYPLYLDIISPYFGMSCKKEVRKVFLDRELRQMQIVFDFEDFKPFFPTQYDINGSEWSSWGQFVKMSYPGFPDVTGGGFQNVGTGVATGGSVGYGYFVVTEDELRVSVGATPNANNMVDPYENWLHYTKVRAYLGYPTAIGRIIYDYLYRAISPAFAKAFMFIPYSTTDPKHRFEAFKMQYFHLITQLYCHPLGRGLVQKEIHTMSEDFQNITASIDNMLKQIHGFIKNIAETHYGKTFSVRLPAIYAYIDSSGKRRYNYEIADAAWEEPGNTLDDTIQIGSVFTERLVTDDNRLPAILGFDNTAEYYYPAVIKRLERVVRFTRSSASPGGVKASETIFGSLFDPFNSAERYAAFVKDGVNGNINQWYWPLLHQIPPESHVLMPYSAMQSFPVPPGIEAVPDYNPTPTTRSAHGFNPLPFQRWKMYTKANVENVNTLDTINPQIIFADGTPRAVLSTPSPVFVKSFDWTHFFQEIITYTHKGDQTPPGMSVVYNPGNNTLPSEWKLPINGLNAVYYYTQMLYFTGNPENALFNDHNGRVYGKGFRAAAPVFAAIPIKNNLMTYGPWVSHPGLIKDTIFPYAYNSKNPYPSIALVNNLCGGVNVQIDEGLVPWEYGGMDPLDAVAMLRVAEDNNFQQVLEYGSLTLAGIMLRNSNAGQSLFGGLSPIVTSVNVSIGDSGITTKYEMKTFSRKLGFYNKEQADNIQKINREILSQNKKMRSLYNEVITRMMMISQKPRTSTFFGGL